MGAGGSFTDEQIFEAACEIAGITVKRGLEVQRLGKQWPVKIEASA
jgi:hypothetical protein